MLNNILLTIAIPTYNRSYYLDICLGQILKQINHDNRIEVLVSDNNSQDNTKDIIDKYKANNIIYTKNEKNIGAEKNVVKCFKKARGKYVLILGDDDLILDNKLKLVLDTLEKNDYGIVYMNNYSYNYSYIDEKPIQKNIINREIDDLKEFTKLVNYYFTFLSGNIINKSIINDININKFVGTNLPQLIWTFSALFNSRKFYYFQEYIVAAKANNTGNYKLFEVFGKNFDMIMIHFENNNIQNKMYLDIIREKLLSIFFPSQIIKMKILKHKEGFENEDYIRVLYNSYGHYMKFWTICKPIYYLPLLFSKVYFKLCKVIGYCR